MPRVDIRQLAAREIEHRVKKSDEPVAGRLPADLHVQPRDQIRGLESFVRERAHHREQQRHQQRGGAAFAGDVANGGDEPAVAERKNLVEVPSNRIRRTAEPAHVDAGRAKDRAEADPGRSAFDIVSDRETYALIEDALSELNPAFRAAVVLRDIEDLSYEEIAEVLGVSLGTVKSRILRGRDALKKGLSSRIKPEPALD